MRHRSEVRQPKLVGQFSPASARTRRLTMIVILAVIGLAAVFGGRSNRATASYSAATAGDGRSIAQLVPPGPTPAALAVGRDMTVTWSESTLTGGTPASDYLVRRYDTNSVEANVGAGCAGLVGGLSCVESAVPAGTWQYTITPILGGWTGTESIKSAPQVTSSAALVLSSPTINALPATLVGSSTGFVAGESLTFRLDSATGSVLAGTPSVVAPGGTDSITVTIPLGTDDTPHSVFAVGGSGTQASHSIYVLDPPTLTALQMFDGDRNGLVDQVVATFSKPLAGYSAGTAPWTLTNVPSGGTLASVSVLGSAATLNLNEGLGSTDTSVGSFTVALAANAAGIRDAGGQTAQFGATLPVDRAAPVVVLRQMFDTDTNGKVDRVTLVVSEPLAAYTAANVGWTLANTPSAGSLSSVAVSASTATLTLAEGAGPADTSVGLFTVALAATNGGIADAAGNLSSDAPTAPIDKAAPVEVAMSMNDIDANGKIDRVATTFSETLAAYTAGTTPWTLTAAPSNATLASVAVSGAVATLTLNEGAGVATTAVGSFTVALASNTTGIRDGAANRSTFTSTAPADGARPVLVALNMNDSNSNGKVDRVTAVFTETLGTYTAGDTPWTLSAVPSTGTLASVAVGTNTATLTIAEGSGPSDTAVGSFTLALASSINGIKDINGNLASFAATAPLDKALPVKLTMAMKDVNGNGKIDQVVVTFSEPLSVYTAGTVPWALASAPSSATLASVSVSAGTATLTLTEGTAAATTAVGSFKITLAASATGIRDAAANLASFASIAPTDAASPVLLTLNMNDANSNGKVDQVTATFTESLSTYSAATAPWTLSAVPSGGTLASVSVVAATTTLTITEGGGAADTVVGSFTVSLASDVNGVKDNNNNLASFTAAPPLDRSKPARLTMVMKDVNANGRVDQVVVTFSEPLSVYTAGTTPWTLVSSPSAATLASVSANGSNATLNLNEGIGAPSTSVGSFRITLAANAAGIRDGAGNQSSFSSIAPSDGAAPVLVTLSMLDAVTVNGKIDRVTAVFSETLSAYSAGNSPWTLTGVPSGGTLASVAVASATATLTITEGAGAPDTTVGPATVALATSATGVRDAANNLASFAANAPLDKAAPARVSMSMYDLNANGKVDRVVVVFSEPLGTYTAGTAPWTLSVPPSGASLAAVAISGSTATLTLAEGAGTPNTAVGTFVVALASNALGVRDAAANVSLFAAVAPSDAAAPVLVTLSMLDSTINGKIDRVTAVFSEALSVYTAGNAPWTLTGIPSGGTLASVAVATTTATLTITEGAGAPDTTVGSASVALATSATGIRDAAANLASFAANAPLDKAAPARVSMSMYDLNGNGRIDQVAATFSEALSTAYAAGITPFTLVAAPSGATVASVSVNGSTVAINLNEGAGVANTAVGSFTIALASNAAGVRDAVDNLASFAAIGPTDAAKPVLLTLSMLDATLNGKIDRLTAVFSEALTAYTAGNSPWTLAGIPSGGTLGSVAVATTTATLTITEGSGSADTTVGSATVALAASASGIRDAAGNLSSFAATTPLDAAGPVVTSIVFVGGANIGKIESGDTMTITFSEPLNPSTIPGLVTVSEADLAGAGNDTLAITGITNGARSTGSDGYILIDAGIADYINSTASLTNANATIVVTVGPTCQNTGCASTSQVLANANLVFAPATSITDTTGNPAAGTRTDPLRIF